jgi:TonB family protein
MRPRSFDKACIHLCLYCFCVSALAGDDTSWEPVHVKAAAYPRVAKFGRVSGIVTLELTLSGEGRVQSVKTLSGHPTLASAAAEAVKTWLFRRTCRSEAGTHKTMLEWRFVLEGNCRGSSCRESFEITLPRTVRITAELPEVEIGAEIGATTNRDGNR